MPPVADLRPLAAVADAVLGVHRRISANGGSWCAVCADPVTEYETFQMWPCATVDAVVTALAAQVCAGSDPEAVRELAAALAQLDDPHAPHAGPGGPMTTQTDPSLDHARDELALWGQLAAAASPGPWTADVDTRGDCVVWGPNGQFLSNAAGEPHWLPAADGSRRQVQFDVDRRDVQFIAAARDAVPRLAAAVEAVLALADRWEHGALRWADPLPVPPEVALVRDAITHALTAQETERGTDG